MSRETTTRQNPAVPVGCCVARASSSAIVCSAGRDDVRTGARWRRRSRVLVAASTSTFVDNPRPARSDHAQAARRAPISSAVILRGRADHDPVVLAEALDELLARSSRPRRRHRKCSRSSATPPEFADLSPLDGATACARAARRRVRWRRPAIHELRSTIQFDASGQGPGRRPGSTAGNIPTRSLVCGPRLCDTARTSTMSLARSVAATAEASTSSARVDRADDERALARVGDENGRGVAAAARPSHTAAAPTRAKRATASVKGRRGRASSRSGRRAGNKRRDKPACCTSGL